VLPHGPTTPGSSGSRARTGSSPVPWPPMLVEQAPTSPGTRGQDGVSRVRILPAPPQLVLVRSSSGSPGPRKYPRGHASSGWGISLPDPDPSLATMNTGATAIESIAWRDVPEVASKRLRPSRS
jgi:hypothetical protein